MYTIKTKTIEVKIRFDHYALVGVDVDNDIDGGTMSTPIFTPRKWLDREIAYDHMGTTNPADVISYLVKLHETMTRELILTNSILTRSNPLLNAKQVMSEDRNRRRNKKTKKDHPKLNSQSLSLYDTGGMCRCTLTIRRKEGRRWNEEETVVGEVICQPNEPYRHDIGRGLALSKALMVFPKWERSEIYDQIFEAVNASKEDLANNEILRQLRKLAISIKNVPVKYRQAMYNEIAESMVAVAQSAER